LHPALPSHPGHALWKRDFGGACGLFSMVLKPVPQRAVFAFLDALELFGIGASWGGYESLAIPFVFVFIVVLPLPSIYGAIYMMTNQ
jgi:cystathionine beta-lyase